MIRTIRILFLTIAGSREREIKNNNFMSFIIASAAQSWSFVPEKMFHRGVEIPNYLARLPPQPEQHHPDGNSNIYPG